jgi:hypothetical protein
VKISKFFLIFCDQRVDFSLIGDKIKFLGNSPGGWRKFMIADHLFVSSTDGGLYDTRVPNWPKHVVRPIYNRTCREITNTHELRATLRAGPYAWPHDYRMYFLTSDGSALSFATVRAEYRVISRAVRMRDCCSGWNVVACEINHEDANLIDEHTGELIESAYCEEEA